VNLPGFLSAVRHYPRLKYWLAGAAILLVGIGLATRHPAHVYRFFGVWGPLRASVVQPARKAQISDYAEGSEHRLAILVTDPDSDWLGLVRGMKAHGIPFVMTRDPDVALRHKTIFVYPIISGRVLQARHFRALVDHVHAGGSLLTFDFEGGGLQELFGIAGPPKPGLAETMIWGPGPDTTGLETARISRTGTEAQLQVLKYEASSGTTVARFETGEPALICHRNVGEACTLGVDLGGLSQRAMNGRAEALAIAYDNAYEPSLDVLYDWLARFYVRGEPMPWLLAPAPPGKDLSILLTHDVDYTQSVANAQAFSDAMSEGGVKGTFFMQTKYVRDYNDDVFFTYKTAPWVRRLRKAGMEIGSHTVAHTRAFKTFDIGTGRERYPDYEPFVTSRTEARGGSILGELRVSKFLLDHLTGAEVRAFRAGHLANPFRLPEALAASGYYYDSSITANSCLTHLPFQLTEGRSNFALEPVYEFPVTIEGEARPGLGLRFETINVVLEQISRRRGLAVVLLHPDITGEKLAFEKNLIAKWRDRAWFATPSTFGDWWRARDDARIDVVQSGKGWTLTVEAPRDVHNLEIYMPKARITGASGGNGLKAGGGVVLANMPAGTQSLSWN
jgi:peptidoglycan/xylan/chitin deacetylase (PgdA/CDA1 family)